MARGVNKVILVGNLGNDPELKYSGGGMAICTLSVATSSTRKNKDGEQVEDTQWHRVKLFGKLGEIAGEYLRKGQQVYIEGSIRYDKFTGSDGQERYFTDIIADEMNMLGGGSGDGERTERQAPRREASRAGAESRAPRREAAPAGDDFKDDDVPF